MSSMMALILPHTHMCVYADLCYGKHRVITLLPQSRDLSQGTIKAEEIETILMEA